MTFLDVHWHWWMILGAALIGLLAVGLELRHRFWVRPRWAREIAAQHGENDFRIRDMSLIAVGCTHCGAIFFAHPLQNAATVACSCCGTVDSAQGQGMAAAGLAAQHHYAAQLANQSKDKP